MKRIPVSFSVHMSDAIQHEMETDIQNYIQGDSIEVIMNVLAETRKRREELKRELAYVTAVELALSEHVAGMNRPHWTEISVGRERCVECGRMVMTLYNYKPKCKPVCLDNDGIQKLGGTDILRDLLDMDEA